MVLEEYRHPWECDSFQAMSKGLEVVTGAWSVGKVELGDREQVRQASAGPGPG